MSEQLSLSFEPTDRRAATPSRPLKHGKTRWWRGRVHYGELTLRVVASPSGVHWPTDVTLDDGLRERAEAFLTREAAKLNRRTRRGGVAA